MVRYEQVGSSGRTVALFESGERVTVTSSRGRGYPALSGEAPNSRAAYEMAAARLAGSATRVADLGAGAGAGAALLASAGLAVTGVDNAPEAVEFARRFAPAVTFERADAAVVDLQGFDALVAVDLLGLVADDAALLRAIAGNAAPGTRLVGAVTRAEIDQKLAAPARRAYSDEALDALLVRAGWTPPTRLGACGPLTVFETRRAVDLHAARAIEAAERAIASKRNEEVLAELAVAARRTIEPAEARELLLALGAAWLARGAHEEAEKLAAAANEIAPRSARPLVLLAAAARARGAVDDAAELLDHALAHDATCVEAWRALAELAQARGELARAAESLAFACALAPADADAARLLSVLYASLGDGASAARALEAPLAYGGAAAVQASYGWLSTTRRGESTGTYPTVRAHNAASSLAS